MSEQPRYLTLAQAADYLNLNLDFVYRLSAQDQLPGLIRYGSRTLRVDRARLDEWVHEQSRKS